MMKENLRKLCYKSVHEISPEKPYPRPKYGATINKTRGKAGPRTPFPHWMNCGPPLGFQRGKNLYCPFSILIKLIAYFRFAFNFEGATRF